MVCKNGNKMPVFADIFHSQFGIPAAWWVGTFAWFAFLITVDLYLNRRQSSRISMKRALIRTAVLVFLGLGLGALIWANFGSEAGSKYFAGYFIEEALSVDNIFVWSLILGYLSIPKQYHYKILFWGIFGAMVFRTTFVMGGLAIINLFSPALILLGLVLLVTSYKLLVSSEGQQFDPEKSRIFKFVERFLPFTDKIEGSKLFIRQNGKIVASLLFFAICVVELTDVLFAIDSVPASLAIVRDPYIVLASNISAILGLRALYFVFEFLEDKFYLLNKGLALILSVIAMSLILEPDNIFGLKWFGYNLSPALTLSFVGVVLSASIVLSLLIPKPATRRVHPKHMQRHDKP